MENDFPAAERILNDIELAFKRDPKLKAFQILPVTLNKNKSPVHHVEHSLGLESWCVPHVYCYAYNLLMEIKQQKRKREDADRLNQLLMGVLLINPDVTLFWNMRREMANLDPQFELHFTSVVLTKKPKSSEVFIYRKWLIQNLLNSFSSDPGLVSAEVYASQLAAELYANNYYAWNHRIWCLNQLLPESGSYISFLINEWMQTHKWVSSHVSDHSGFHYRQYLLAKFVSLPPSGFSVIRKCTVDIEQNSLWSLRLFFSPSQSKDDNQLTETTKSVLCELLDSQCEKIQSIPLGLILSEYFFNTDLLFVYPGHEAIWNHRRFIINTFRDFVFDIIFTECQHIGNHKDNNGVSLEKTKRIETTGDTLMKRLIRFETVLYSRCRNDKDRQATYAEKHRAWLASIMKINLHLPLR